MVSRFLSSLALILALISPQAMAQVTVSDPWIRGTVTGQKATGAFMQLQSETDTALVGVATPVAGVAEIHEMAMDGGMMRMRAVAKLPLPAGKPVALKSGGFHLMLMDLKSPLKEGDAVDLTLRFEDKDGRKSSQQIKVPVKSLTAGGATMKH